jgi:NAD dependent epimerase/dehydratase family enzyme
MRKVILRTSFVLGREGGALPRLARLARWGLGGTIGHGWQGMSWIHERDMNRLFERALTDESMTGVYVATAPQPVSNAEFMKQLRRAVGRRFGLPTPAIGVRIAAPLVMRTDPELALYGRYCVSKRLRDERFNFEFPTLAGALTDLCGRPR